jgi:predicted RNase H-like HicB family nuclease
MAAKQANRRLSYTVIFEPAEEGGYVASVPALPGCFTEAETLDEARANIQEAMEGYLETLLAHGQPVPEDIKTDPVYEKVAVALPAVRA